MFYLSVLLLVVIVAFLFLIFRRAIYYQNLIEESIERKDYGSALLYSQIIGSWWLINYFAEKTEKEFTELNTFNAVSCIEALIKVRENKRVRRILFNKVRERDDRDILLKRFWEKC